MKKLRYFLMLGVFCLLAVGCDKEEESTSGQSASYNTFVIKSPSLRSDSKSFVRYSSTLSDILYEEGDKVYINDVEFTVRFNASENSWEAVSSTGEGVEDIGGSFYCCSADGEVKNWNETNKTYSVNMSNYRETTTGIVLAGSTEDNTLQFTPCFAVLVFAPAEVDNYTKVQVGFDNNKIPYNFTVNATNPGSISGATEFYGPASSTISNRLMTMKNEDRDGNPLGYYYVAIPIYGSQISTKLYFQYTRSDEAQPIQRVTEAQVTLKQGYVYIIPSEDMSEYPFDEDGASRHVFSVASGRTVKFSAGNLQFHPRYYAWRFAPHQYDQLSTTNNQNVIEGVTDHFIDLFGWATSDYDISPATNSQKDEDFGPADADLSVTDDWGYNSAAITYGSRATRLQWRTLSQDEWHYLLLSRNGAASKYGFAVIANHKGMVILPDDWVLPYGVSFVAGDDNSNTYTLQQWDKMEKAGAIFLPACGYKNDPSTVSAWNSTGRYWTATHEGTTHAHELYFDDFDEFKLDFTAARHTGLSVRLVTD